MGESGQDLVGGRNVYTGPQETAMAKHRSDFLLASQKCLLSSQVWSRVCVHVCVRAPACLCMLWRETTMERLIIKLITNNSGPKFPDVSISIDPTSFPNKTEDNERGLLWEGKAEGISRAAQNNWQFGLIQGKLGQINPWHTVEKNSQFRPVICFSKTDSFRVCWLINLVGNL